MPDVSYTIYVRQGTDERTSLVLLGEAKAANPKAAVRTWYRGATASALQSIEGEKLVVIPTRNHHELAPSIETQPRLVF